VRHEICYRVQVSIDLGSRHEIHANAIGIESRLGKNGFHGVHVPLGSVITGLEVTFSLVTSEDADSVGPVTQRLYDIRHVDSSRAFHPDKINIGRILIPGNTDQVSGRISSLFATKDDDLPAVVAGLPGFSFFHNYHGWGLYEIASDLPHRKFLGPVLAFLIGLHRSGCIDGLLYCFRSLVNIFEDRIDLAAKLVITIVAQLDCPRRAR